MNGNNDVKVLHGELDNESLQFITGYILACANMESNPKMSLEYSNRLTDLIVQCGINPIEFGIHVNKALQEIEHFMAKDWENVPIPKLVLHPIGGNGEEI